MVEDTGARNHQNHRSGPKVKPRWRRADFPGAAADWLGRQAKQLRTAERHRPFVFSFFRSKLPRSSKPESFINRCFFIRPTKSSFDRADPVVAWFVSNQIAELAIRIRTRLAPR